MRIVQGKNNYILLSGSRTWQEAWLWLECSLLAFPFLSFLFTPFLFIQKTFAEPHLYPLLWFHGWRKESLKIILPTEEPPWQKYLILWSFGLHSEPQGCSVTCPECVPEGSPCLLTSFHPVPPPEGPTTPNSTTARDQASHVQDFQILRINHNVSLLTCLSQVQVHSHCLRLEALWLFFLCLWVNFGRLKKDKSSGPVPVFLGRGCRHPPCCSSCEDLVRGRLWRYMATYITFVIG